MIEKKVERILLIDDDPASCYVTVEILTQLNIATHIDQVKNGIEAYEYLVVNCLGSTKRFPCPDLVLLDINMPVMGGFEFLELCKAMEDWEGYKLCIYLLTSSELAKDMDMAKRYAEVKGYITKPLTEEKVLAIFNQGLLSQV